MGLDDPAERERGTRELLGNLDAALRHGSASIRRPIRPTRLSNRST